MSIKSRLWRAVSLLALLALFLAPFGSTARAITPQLPSQNQAAQEQTAASPQVIRALHHDTSLPLRELAPKAPPAEALKSQRELSVFPLTRPGQTESPLGSADPAVQNKPLGSNMPSFDFNFEGLSNEDNRSALGFTVAPPDTAGAIGPDHYIQWVNLVFAIYEVDRATNSATMVYGPAAGNSLWAGFGGTCETNNDGDIIVLYDRLANRWFMSQFGLFADDGNWHQCVAVSATSDPLGEWYRYDFNVSETKLNDYPKFGVWPDAYYMTANQFDENTFNWAGQGVWALERDQMLLGQSARMVYFDLFGADPNLGGMLPSDLDGLTLPPDGAPNPFLLFDDDAWGYVNQDQLQVWEFHVDWATPASSTFTHAADLATEPFDAQICTAFRGACIDQPNGNKVEDLADRLMYRLQYRNFGDHQTLVVNHSVDVTFSEDNGQAGVRWYELRDDGSGWGIYQQGSYAPDGDHRWMGSAAMDATGNLAVGYSVSSTETFPSIRYTGRLAGDPLNTLPQGEIELAAGSDSQEGTARWGDYSMITLDPLDDCTFWYTQEYVSGPNADNWGNWFTRVGSFKFPTCTTGPAGNLQGTVTSSTGGTPVAGARIDLGNGIVTVTDADGFYQFINLPEGSYDVTAWAYGYIQETVTGVTVTDGATTTQDFVLDEAPVVTITGTVTDLSHGWPLYAEISIETIGFETSLFTNPMDGSYTVDLLQDTPYTFTVNAVTPGYLAEVRDVTPPAGGGTEDFVLQADLANCVAPGYALVTDFTTSEDFEADDGGFTASGDTSWAWGMVTYGPPGAHSGENAWATNLSGDYNDNENGETTSPTVDLSAFAGQGIAVQWWQWLQSEEGFDYASVQVSNDGGANWATVYGPVTGDIDLDWKEYTVLLDSSYAVSDFQVRFRFTSDVSVVYPGYYVDDVSIGSATCTPLAGGLVVGNVFDANTGEGVVGATVTSDNNPDDSAVSFATPDDAALEDGFYVLFSSLTGTNPFTATASKYGSDTQDVTVVADSVVTQDFNLPAGVVVADPTALEATLDIGETASLPFTLTNTGGADASFELTERDAGMTPAGRQGAPKVHRSGYFTPYRLNADPKSLIEGERPR
ncbi:MAG: hypothetical protein H6Q38_2718, partial [Chloroflexi bacterium]|nr:hypothetical protein [Chloroflexota bacterium]